MTWLGGGGYSHLGLYLHGINYTKQDGSKVFGTYLPVLFENLADPIITGRDELGFPKLFADINVKEAPGKCSIDLSWREIHFGTFEIKGLKRAEPVINGEASKLAKPGMGPPPPPPEQGQFVYRYVPAVGEPGKADAEYAVLCPYLPKDETAEPEKLETKEASIEFQARDWQSLPTLHHIAAKLAQVPVYGIEKAEMTQGVGVGDLSTAVRI